MSKYLEVLKQYWAYSAFRPLQEEIVRSAGDGRDTLALMPTGGGKSITFQVPALASKGICLVVTPLIALMTDQVANLRKRGIKAQSIHSGMSRDEINIALDNCVFGEIKFLYLSPERLATAIFRAKVQQMDVNLIAVDEAHCISQWGYDFRPSYLRISELRKLLPETPVLALTATATPAVAKDIMEQLDFQNGNLLKKSFERKNLTYLVRKTEDKEGELLKLLSRLDGSGIIYVRNRRKTRDIADLLKREGVAADYYHAGLKYDTRMLKQENWQKGRIRIMIATNAFGMGIDKPDVRFVIHLDLPDSPEAYFQEAGRAGRDEQQAYAILLHSPADLRQVERRVQVNFPPVKTLKEIYSELYKFLGIPIGAGKGASYDFILGEFLARVKMDALTVNSALATLSREGYFEITEEINNPSRIHFLASREDLYRLQSKDEEFDAFLKVVLRSYSGLFSQYVAFDESVLARRAGLTREKVYDYLLKLSGRGLINYIPQKQHPVITFFEERLDEKNIYIDQKRYSFRKQSYVNRIKELVNYATKTETCRSRFLLAYFGELQASNCGQCDVCKSGSLKKSMPEEAVKEVILKTLDSGPVSLEMLVQSIDSEHDVIAQVLEKLIQEKLIRRRPDLFFEAISV